MLSILLLDAAEADNKDYCVTAEWGISPTELKVNIDFTDEWMDG